MKSSQLRNLVTKFDRARLDDIPIVDLLHTAERREREVRAAHAATVVEAQQAVNTAADQVAADPASFANAAQAVVIAAGIVEPSKNLAAKAVGRIYAEAQADFARLWADTDAEIIALHDQAMTDLAALASTLEGIDDDKTAVTSGPKIAAAWVKADAIASRREAFIALRELVAEVLGLADYRADDDLRQYRRPELLRSWPRDGAPKHRVTRLLDDIDAGAEPALCTDAEVAALAERFADHRPERVNPFGHDPLTDLGHHPQDNAGPLPVQMVG